MNPLLNRRVRFSLFKFIGLLSLVRWYSILSVMLAQYLASVFILHSPDQAREILSDPYLHLMILSSACIVASGFIINSFYDLERDIINRPKNVVFARLVSQQTCLNFYFLFNTVGMILSFYVSKRVMLFNFLFSIALWFYSHKLKRMSFVGNIAATALTIAPFLILILYYEEINYAIFFYVAFMACIVLIREVVKDLIAEKGDVIYGYHSIPVDFGLRKTKRLLYFLMILCTVPPVLLYMTYAIDWVIVYFALSAIAILISGVWLARATRLKDFERINNLYKIIIVTGIFSIVLV